MDVNARHKEGEGKIWRRYSRYLSPEMRLLCLATFSLLALNLLAQTEHTLQAVSADKPKEFFTKKFSYRTQTKDSTQAQKEGRELFEKLRSFGYLGASIDSMVSDSAITHIYMYVGEKSDRIVLKNGNVEGSLIGSAGVRHQLSGKPIDISDVEVVKGRILRELENNGYPFAAVRLDSFESEGGMHSAKVYMQKNELIVYDTINLVGKTKVKRAFLKNYLGIKPNKPYNESNISRIKERMNELQFAESIQPYNVEFQNGKAKLNLFLKDKKASQFDLLLGLLPGSSGRKLLITGEARIYLISPFGMGEEFYLQWKKLQPKTQQLDVRISYPYLVGLPLGLSARFELYKRDTSYLDLDGDYGVQYQIIGSSYLKASLHQHNTIVTNVDTAYVIRTRSLPKVQDISTNEFALEYFLQRLNYRFNPVSGYVLRVGGSAGVKPIKRNNTITGLYDELTDRNFDYLYENDSVRLKSFQFRLALAIDKYWRLASRHTIRTSFEGKYFYNRVILDNDKYRIGGVNSLRGFDDQSIFTPYYGIVNVEYRFLLSKNSYFSAFFNSAVVEDTRVNKGPIDFPFGFGAGAAIETKAGIFGITYAMGKQLDNKITFNSAKIHFGYVNYF
jgi:outer membrane protein assembly factor BamA